MEDLSLSESLDNVSIHSCVELADVSGLARCLSLHTLAISDCGGISGIGAFGGCSNLEVLRLNNLHSRSFDVAGLRRSTSLRVVSLRGCEYVRDVNCLAECRGLESVDIADCNGVADVFALSRSDVRVLNPPDSVRFRRSRRLADRSLAGHGSL